MSNLNDSVYLCKEVFDENSEPTKLEIEEQASRLGIDPAKELHLLSIAKQCLLEPLPSNWLPCYIEKENKYFYFNNQSKTSQWEHPLDEYYRQIIEKIHSEDSSTGQDISLNIILDEENYLFDIMYHTKNNNYEKKNVTEKRTVRFKTPIEESLDLDDSDDNMKFLGPIKLNTPYTNTLSNVQSLPQFSTTNTFDPKSTGSRSVLSKYNILPSKDESSRKSDLGEKNKAVNNFSPMNINYNTGKENLRKIDITLTESSDRSESTSSEIRTENLISENEGEENGISKIDLKETDNVVTKIQINKQPERNIDDGRSASKNFNNTIGTTQLYNIKRDDLVSDSGNSTGKDSKILQSSNATNSFSATKSKTAEFPLNQFTNETKLLKIKSIESEGVNDIVNDKSNNIKFELKNDLNDKKQTFLEIAQIKVLIENHCDLIKNKMEDTIKTKEKFFREELIKKIDDIIHEQNYNIEKRIEARHNELFTKNELELKNLIKNMQEKTEHSLIEKCDQKYVQNISNPEQMCAENVFKFQKDLDDYSEIFKNQIQLEIDAISDKLKKEHYKNSEIITDELKQELGLCKHDAMEKIKKYFEHTTENVICDTDNDIHKLNLELKEKLKIISEEKLNKVTDKLDLALQEEIDIVKKQVHENVETFNHKPPSNQELNSERTTIDMHKVNYSSLIKTIQHCSNELHNALKLINKISSNECTSEHSMDLYPKKCTVSCQTENIVISHRKPNLYEYTYPESSNSPLFNNPYDTYTNYADYWNKSKISRDLYSNYMTTYSQVFHPLDILSREEIKVNAAEQNICNLIGTFNSSKPPDAYHIPKNTNIYQNKFTDIYQPLTPKQIAYNRTKHLREWLHKTDLNNKYK